MINPGEENFDYCYSSYIHLLNMIHPSKIFRTSFLITIIIMGSGLLLSCENKIDPIPKSDLLTLPSRTGTDLLTVLNDSGQVQLEMYSPLMEQYDNTDNKYTEFRSGINIIFYDGQKESVASVTAKYAKYTNSDDIWELRDSVVVINEGNDKLETELLNWSQEKDLIYTDRYVKITSENQIIHGFGFESDSHLRDRTIKKVQATIYLPDEE